ncbi:MAG: peptide-binding protein, partial [Proteobacteria bacterium]|nr:peptide-binding protein [Pseudomonadota bacterium]MBU1611504.1 peptide-binding protein [Pseudomonadota bacterium]
QATQFMELKAGALDLSVLTPMDYVYQTSDPWWRDHFDKYEYIASGYTFLGYNLRPEHPLFTDVRVRRALTFAIDKQEVVDGVLFGLGLAANGPYKPDSWAYNPNIPASVYDPAKALTLLAEVGWEDHDGDGLLDKDGRPFAFTILTNQGNSQRINTAIIIQERLRQIGIQVKVRTVEWAAFLNEFVDPGHFDAVILAWSVPPDPDIHAIWHSKADARLNFTRYSNPEVDTLLDAGRATLDQAERKRIYWKVQEYLYEDQPYCFLYVSKSLPIVNRRIQGVEPAPSGIGHNSEWWWIPRSLQTKTALTP